MSYRVKNEIENTGKEILINRYIIDFDKAAKKKNNNDDWLHLYLAYCLLEAQSEGRGMINTQELYELNVRPLALKTGMKVTVNDFRAALEKLKSYGHANIIDRKETGQSNANPHRTSLQDSIKEDGFMEALETLKKHGLARYDLSNGDFFFTKKYEDVKFKMSENITKYIEEVQQKVTRQQYPDKVYMDEVAEEIIDRFNENYEYVDERIVMGMIPECTDILLTEMTERLKQGYDANPSDLLTTGILLPLRIYAYDRKNFSVDVKGLCNASPAKLAELAKKVNTEKKDSLELVLLSIVKQFGMNSKEGL